MFFLSDSKPLAGDGQKSDGRTGVSRVPGTSQDREHAPELQQAPVRRQLPQSCWREGQGWLCRFPGGEQVPQTPGRQSPGRDVGWGVVGDRQRGPE